MGLPSAGAGNRGVDCNTRWGADGGPVAPRVGDGNTKRVGGVNDGNSGRSMQGGARDTEPERAENRRGAGPTGMTNVGGGDGGARLTVAEGVTLRRGGYQ